MVAPSRRDRPPARARSSSGCARSTSAWWTPSAPGTACPAVSAIAAEALGGAVVLVRPGPAGRRRRARPRRPAGGGAPRYVADHAVQRPPEVPPGLVAEVPIVSAGRTLGAAV